MAPQFVSEHRPANDLSLTRLCGRRTAREESGPPPALELLNAYTTA